MSSNQRVFVTDFDGTMTDVDFYTLVKSQLLPANQHDYWDDYRAGKLTHFEALKAYFGAIRNSEGEVLKLLAEMKFDPQSLASIATLTDHDWKVVIASAGCDWYINKLLTEAGIEVEVHANPGYFMPNQGLLMELPTASPFYSHEHGIYKAGIVKHYLNSSAVVAFAGDGFPDVDAALLVPVHLRFARRDLAAELTSRKESFRPFEHWSEIVHNLMQMEPK